MSMGLSNQELPPFIEQAEDGLFVDTAQLPSGQDMAALLDRLFSGAMCLQGLTYSALLRLVYHHEAPVPGRVRLADGLRPIPDNRRSLYRSVQIQGDEVEYLFEPILPEDGSEEPVKLDFDEFVAEMWLKGVRYGLDEIRIREAIESDKSERIIIAHALQPREGSDAVVQEQTPELHRDDAPKRLPDGRVDLNQFKNRFPQISDGKVLLKKVPARSGAVGYSISGEALPAPPPKDLELQALAGPGTRVEKNEEGEFIVAAMDGFLSIDKSSNQISITDHIVNRDGVSSHTTGDLVLEGDYYEEYGEIQERRLVDGKNLTLHADVFGRLVSHEGLIHLDKNLIGGSALNHKGDIEVAGLASGSTLEAPLGTLRLKRAESCLLQAVRVEAETLINCVVLADVVDIKECDGCTLGVRNATLASSDAKGAQETVVSMLMPDMSVFDQRRDELEKTRHHLTQQLEALAQDRETLMALPEVQRYLTISARIQRHEITLNPAQQAGWQKVTAQVAPNLQRLARIRQQEREFDVTMQAMRQQLETIEQDRRVAGAGLRCALETIKGDTRVRTRFPERGERLKDMPAKTLSTALRQGEGRVLFSGAVGSFSWCWEDDWPAPEADVPSVEPGTEQGDEYGHQQGGEQPVEAHGQG